MDRAVYQVVSGRPLAAEAWVLSQLRYIVEKVAQGKVFAEYFGFPPVTVIAPMPHTHLHLDVALTGRTNSQSRGTFHKASEIGGRWIGNYFYHFLGQLPPVYT
jgi:hypothetical protein